MSGNWTCRIPKTTKIDYLLIKGGKSASEDVGSPMRPGEDEMLQAWPLSEKDKPFLDSSAQVDTEIDLANILEGRLLFHWLECHRIAITVYGWILRNITVNINRRTVCRNISDYCKRNGITKDRLAKETGYDGMDVMTLYDRQAAKTAPEKKPKDMER